ncbi:hypothetical protein GN109_06015 [Collimonas pratensis]|uniref:baseplate J/gp47 family protein n=1 Tax=Collimonas pratensis TaxID=279113 RepID=UPI00143CFFAD|nr:baseplate J/gp47 family protein [Collimonas pratensis]NKI68969.1 hypothetical protein [Collimonas pratensis]
MTGTTSVPDAVFTPTGLVIPDESAILTGVQADMNAAFGGNLNPGLSTPQGQIASSTAAIVGDKNNLFAEFVNQIDPANASGFMQDAIGRIYFMDRLPATSTTVQVICLGLAGVVIPTGALVQDSSGNKYSCTGGGTIPVGGSITLTFAAVNTGPIVCGIGAITTIYQSINGWDSVSNSAAGVTGTVVESRADFEYRRQQSVAVNAVGSLPSIYANVFSVANVSDVYVTENVTSSPVTNGSITLAPHSIYVAAVGGIALSIATAIWNKKSVGADYNGNTSVVVTDNSGYSIPLPTYTVKFQIPTAQPILFAVSIANLSTLPSNIITLIKNAIISAFSGGDGGSRARIGSTLYASRYYAPVSAVSPASVEILSLKIGTVTANLDALTVDIGFVPTVTAANITVTLV